MTPDQRMKADYGGIKKALDYCVELGMNKFQSARHLEIDIKTLRNRAGRFDVTFPCGYATRDTTLMIEVNRTRLIAANKAGTMGGRVRWNKVRA